MFELKKHLVSVARVGTAALFLVLQWEQLACGQTAVVSTPSSNVSSSFYERTGVGFDVSFPNGFFNFNQGAMPPFGGHDPNADATLAFKVGNASFNFAFGQGSNQTISSATPTVIVPNGGTGFVSDVSLQPFVTGYIPVVGGAVFGPGNGFGNINTIAPPAGPSISPVALGLARLQAEGVALGSYKRAAAHQPVKSAKPTYSSATHGDVSVVQIRRHNELLRSAKEAEISAFVARANRAESRGELDAAIQLLNQARRAAKGDKEKREELESQMKRLRTAVLESATSETSESENETTQ